MGAGAPDGASRAGRPRAPGDQRGRQSMLEVDRMRTAGASAVAGALNGSHADGKRTSPARAWVSLPLEALSASAAKTEGAGTGRQRLRGHHRNRSAERELSGGRSDAKLERARLDRPGAAVPMLERPRRKLHDGASDSTCVGLHRSEP